MQITTEQFTQAVEKWIDTDLANKGSIWQKGLLVFLVNQGRPKLEQLLNSMQIKWVIKQLFRLLITHLMRLI